LRTLGLSGGIKLLPHREQGEALRRWLGELRRKAADATVTVLMEKRYRELYFAPLPPEHAGAEAPAGVEFRLYDDLRDRPRKAGILVLVEPEEALFDEDRNRADGDLIARIRAMEPLLLLGVFSDTWRFLNDPGWQSLRALFGMRTADGTAKYLFRDAAAALPPPEAHVFPPPVILRPSAEAPFFTALEEKFRRLPMGDLLSELSCFGTGGKKAPFVPPGSRTLFFDRMDEGERAYFFYWRGAFREGRTLKTAEAYVRLYIRELCLFTGKEEGPEDNFRELLRLWRSCRKDFPSLDGDLLRWLYDYAVIYGIEDAALPRLLPFVHDGPCPPLTDRYLYRAFIKENNGIGLADLLPLTGTAAGGLLSPAAPPAKDYTAVVNGVDRFLRERFRLRFFEFFYPPAVLSERRRAFEGLPLTGDSFYTDGGARFTLHRPLGAFLAALFRYTDYRAGIKTGGERPRQAPPLEGVWRDIADAVLEGQGRIPEADFRPSPDSSSIDRLREESDQVRALLLRPPGGPGTFSNDSGTLSDNSGTFQNDSGTLLNDSGTFLNDSGAFQNDSGTFLNDSGTFQNGPGTLSNDSGTFQNDSGTFSNGSGMFPKGPLSLQRASRGGDLAAFLEGLGPVEAAALALIAGGERGGLDALARRHHTMAEPLVDGINEKFLDAFGDLLVETMDEGPRIAAEYKETVEKTLTGRPEQPDAAGR
jgi:hypothetical protein